MKARPILFSAPMIKALLAGTKTQTRRVVKYPTPEGTSGWHPIPSGWQFLPGGSDRPVCPYGKPGDLLWVRETIRQGRAEPEYMAFAADDQIVSGGERSWPSSIETRKTIVSIHMPRWASRLTLRISDVRVQRLQEISEADAMAEGVPFTELPQGRTPDPLHVGQFADLWESINGPESWHANPWVWALTFEVIKANVDTVLP